MNKKNEGIEMKMREERGIGYCGLVCALCEDDEQCVGCKQGGCQDIIHCKNYHCCKEHELCGCYECESFPCLDTILYKTRIRAFSIFLQRYGEDKLIECLLRNQKQGIQYHKNNNHYGDYDEFENEEDIIKFILEGKS